MCSAAARGASVNAHLSAFPCLKNHQIETSFALNSVLISFAIVSAAHCVTVPLTCVPHGATVICLLDRASL